MAKLLAVLRELAGRGNTVVVIEHDLEVFKAIDWIIELGSEGLGRPGEIVVVEGGGIAREKRR